MFHMRLLVIILAIVMFSFKSSSQTINKLALSIDTVFGMRNDLLGLIIKLNLENKSDNFIYILNEFKKPFSIEVRPKPLENSSCIVIGITANEWNQQEYSLRSYLPIDSAYEIQEMMLTKKNKSILCRDSLEKYLVIPPNGTLKYYIATRVLPGYLDLYSIGNTILKAAKIKLSLHVNYKYNLEDKKNLQGIIVSKPSQVLKKSLFTDL